ncbi:MAG: hypothetical protein H7835_15215, partial [Magnetococcus sp. XQGC-1]
HGSDDTHAVDSHAAGTPAADKHGTESHGSDDAHAVDTHAAGTPAADGHGTESHGSDDTHAVDTHAAGTPAADRHGTESHGSDDGHDAAENTLDDDDALLVTHGADVDENMMFEMDGGQHGFGDHGSGSWDNFVDGDHGEHGAVASQGEWLSQTDEQDGNSMGGAGAGHEENHYFQEAPPPPPPDENSHHMQTETFPSHG